MLINFHIHVLRTRIYLNYLTETGPHTVLASSRRNQGILGNNFMVELASTVLHVPTFAQGPMHVYYNL